MATTPPSSSCDCTDNAPLFSERSNCEFTDPETGERQPGILYRQVCYPVSYGSNECATHDLGVDPRCPDEGNSTTSMDDMPEWCEEQFCYVDPEACRLSSDLLYRSTMFEGVYYSYSVCNGTADNWLQYQTTEGLRDVTLRVTIPIVRDKAHYKLKAGGTANELASSSGPEYYDDSVPWAGFMVDYFDAVVELSDMKGVEYTYRTKGADTLGLGAFTGVVHDVQAGLTDLALSSYWITSDRLQMTPYTTPVFVDQVVLWVPQPESTGGSLADNVSKIFEPFEPSLWIALGATIVLTACVNIWLSTTRGVHSYLSKRIRGGKWRRATMLERFRIISGMVMDSLMVFSTYFFGHAVELDWQSVSHPMFVLSVRCKMGSWDNSWSLLRWFGEFAEGRVLFFGGCCCRVWCCTCVLNGSRLVSHLYPTDTGAKGPNVWIRVPHFDCRGVLHCQSGGLFDGNGSVKLHIEHGGSHLHEHTDLRPSPVAQRTPSYLARRYLCFQFRI